MNTGFVNADNSQETSLVDETGSHNGTLNNFALTGASSNWIEGHVTGTASIFQNNPVTISFDGDGKLTCANPSVQLTASGTGAFLWSTGATTSSIFVTNPGDYTVTKTDAGGCSSSTTTSVLQDTTEPGISIFTPSTVFTCESPGIGNAIALWVWGNGTATVSNSNNILMDPYEVGAWSIGEPGTYTATITGANGCTSTQQITYTSNFNPPSITITNNSGTTLLSCSVSNISVTASGGRSYSWDGGNSPNTAENSFTLPGVYTVTVTGYNGCTATNSITILESQDVTPPTITCPTTITINTSPGLCTGTTTLTPPTVTDNCNSLGNALNFNGGYVNVPHSSLITPLNAWTIETWVRRTTTNTQESLIEKYSNAYGVYGYLLRIQGDYAVTSFLISSNFGYTLTGNTPLLPNVWYHLAATFNRASGEIKLYVNGVLDGQLTGLSGLPTDPGTQ
ncbi:MAG TPA: LamG domain-containing protein, partial [Saprospiraceae bacterium]|nr:LamG domain-containing protein [Saprospiraceae bacterium]